MTTVNGTASRFSMASHLARHFNNKLATFNGLFQWTVQDDMCKDTTTTIAVTPATNLKYVTARSKIRRGSSGADTKELDMLVLKTNGDDSEGYQKAYVMFINI